MFQRIVLILAAVLHFAFVVGEMLPVPDGADWLGQPPLMSKLTGKKNKELDDKEITDPKAKKVERIKFNETESPFVATVVRNAGIYNFIIACGFVWAAFPGISRDALNPRAARAVGMFFSGGALVAGLFGVTLSLLTLVQAGVGVLGIVACYLAPIDATR